jgi:hypothetical protein
VLPASAAIAVFSLPGAAVCAVLSGTAGWGYVPCAAILPHTSAASTALNSKRTIRFRPDGQSELLCILSTALLFLKQLKDWN